MSFGTPPIFMWTLRNATGYLICSSTTPRNAFYPFSNLPHRFDGYAEYTYQLFDLNTITVTPNAISIVVNKGTPAAITTVTTEKSSTDVQSQWDALKTQFGTVAFSPLAPILSSAPSLPTLSFFANTAGSCGTVNFDYFAYLFDPNFCTQPIGKSISSSVSLIDRHLCQQYHVGGRYWIRQGIGVDRLVGLHSGRQSTYPTDRKQ